MFKNVASQKIAIFAFDTATSLPKTGDAANITAYVSKDYGTVTALTDTSATEMDATNAKGWYLFDVAQAETNADALLFSGKSSTSGISVVGMLIFTTPPNFSTAVIDSTGNVAGDVKKLLGTAWLTPGVAGTPDVNAKQIGATAQTGRDIGLSVLVSAGTGTGQLDLASGAIKIRSGMKKNTAISCFRFFMTLTGTNTPATGKTLTLTRGIDTGAQAAGTLGACVEIGGGEYYTSFAQADTNGDCVMFKAAEASCNTLEIQMPMDP